MQLSKTVLLSLLTGSALSASVNANTQITEIKRGEIDAWESYAQVLRRNEIPEEQILAIQKRGIADVIVQSPALLDKFIYFVFLDHGFHGAIINSLIQFFSFDPLGGSATLWNGISKTTYFQSMMDALSGGQDNSQFMGTVANMYYGTGTSTTSTSHDGGMDMGSSDGGFDTTTCTHGATNDGGSAFKVLAKGILTGSIVKDTFDSIIHDTCLVSKLFVQIALKNMLHVSDLLGAIQSAGAGGKDFMSGLSGCSSCADDVKIWVDKQGGDFKTELKSYCS